MDYNGPGYIKQARATPEVVWTDRPAKQRIPDQAPTQAPPPPNEDERGVGGDETFSESLSKDVFATYKCRSIQRGIEHPGDIAEASGLSACLLPPADYPLWDSIRDDIVDRGLLSQLQLEGVMYASMKHLQWLPSGQRAGFFIGDGAGVGKGRQIAGIVLDNFARGRRRAVWLSTSSDLHHDAERDLRDLGCAGISIINNVQTLDKGTKVVGLSKDLQEGVLFMTYHTLISPGKGKTRLQQVIDWVGGPQFDGVIVFDEAHKAKNFVPGAEGKSTKVSQAVLALQEQLPKARIVYCSATGVSEVGNMAYMSRLGLWVAGSAFENFEAFLDSMKKRGVSFLEMLAMEMKLEGFYVARGLSFREAEFMELPCDLTPEQRELYDQAVEEWRILRLAVNQALVTLQSASRDVWKAFWATQQRFFKLLCVSMKIPMVVKEAKAALAEGQCVVIGLQATGEAAAQALDLQPGTQCGWVSVTQQMLVHFVKGQFPVKKDQPPEGADASQPAGPDDEERQCIAMRDVLLERYRAGKEITLPPNFLDQLIHELGGPNAVSEMTGRKGRIVSDKNGRGVYQLRGKPDSAELDSLNVKETEAFMRGKKLIAIVSDAASTGISLHASKQCNNQRRRVHLTIELPWSADKAIQQLGRSHRSNQVCGPVYKLVSTNLGGEKRFAAAVSRRLQSLGALTRGDRRAASGIDLSESNFDSPLGRKSLRRMYDHITLALPQLPPGVSMAEVVQDSEEAELIAAAAADTVSPAQVEQLHADLRDCCDLMGIGLSGQSRDTIVEADTAAGTATASGAKDLGDVRRFLNRLLGVAVAKQNLLFGYFAATLAAEIRAAKAEGRYFEGMSELAGVPTLKQEPDVVWTDRNSGLQTLRNILQVDRGMSFEVAVQRLEHERRAGDSSGFRRSRRPIFGQTMYLLALQNGLNKHTFSICRPNTGASFFDMERDELETKYQRVSAEEVEEGWKRVHEFSAVACMHGDNCSVGDACQTGRRITEVAVLSGSVVRIWGALERILSRHEHQLSRSDRTMRVLRVDLGPGNSLVGVRYPSHLLPEVTALLQSAEQQAALAQSQLANGTGGHITLQKQKQQQEKAMRASAMGAASAIRHEPATPVDPKSLAKAFRAPKKVTDFFRPKAAGSPAAAPAAEAAKGGRPSPSGAQPLHDSLNGSRRLAGGQQRLAAAAKPQIPAPKRQEPGGQQNQRQQAAPKRQRVDAPPQLAPQANGSVIDLAMSDSGAAAAADHAAPDAATLDTAGTPPFLAAAADADGASGGAGGGGHDGSGPDAMAAAAADEEFQARPSCYSSQHTPGSGSKTAAFSESAVNALTSMGFSRDQAERALWVTHGSADRAAAWLADQMT